MISYYPDSSNTWENVFYLQDTSDALFSDFAGAATALTNAFNTNLKPWRTPQEFLTEWVIEDVRGSVFLGEAFPVSPAIAGTYGAAGSLPSNTCIAVKKSTGNPGRAGRGRWYWGVFAPAALTGIDVVGTVYAGDVVAALGAFQDDIETALSPATMGIVSYHLNGSPRSAGLFQRITQWSVADYLVDTQRRRLLGHNRHR